MMTLGQIAFEAYKQACIDASKQASTVERMIMDAFSSIKWDHQSTWAKNAWEAAADAVNKQTNGEGC